MITKSSFAIGLSLFSVNVYSHYYIHKHIIPKFNNLDTNNTNNTNNSNKLDYIMFCIAF